MNNPRLAIRYAKSIVDLAIEQNQLQEVYQDMRYIKSVCKQSKEFLTLLRSPVISNDKKKAIFSAVIGDKVSPLTNKFVALLAVKNREGNLPEIAEAIIDRYYDLNHIHRVKLTSAAPLSAEMQSSIVERIKAAAGIEHVELETAVDEKLVGGFTLQLKDKFIDASILRDLKDIQKQFMNNDYIHAIR